MNEPTKLTEAVTQGDLERVRILLDADGGLVGQRDGSGSTPLHHAAWAGHRDIARLLVERGADINSADGEFGATPAGWAIEYLREMGGYLGIELRDFAHAIERGDTHWVARWLQRFPSLRHASGTDGRPFRELALVSGHREIVELFATDDDA